MDKDQTTTPGTTCPTLCDGCVGSLTSPASHYSEDAGDGAYGSSSLSRKTRLSNHLQMSLQSQHTSNSNWTECSTIQGVIVQVILKSCTCKAQGQFEIMCSINP